MEEYILIFRHEDGNKVASPEQMAIWMQQTKDWVTGIAARNKFVGSNGILFENAKVVRKENSKLTVVSGPFGKVKEAIGGYIIVKAGSVDEAVEFAKGCPVLQGEGNSVEVRKIVSGSEVMKKHSL